MALLQATDKNQALIDAVTKADALAEATRKNQALIDAVTKADALAEATRKNQALIDAVTKADALAEATRKNQALINLVEWTRHRNQVVVDATRVSSPFSDLLAALRQSNVGLLSVASENAVGRRTSAWADLSVLLQPATHSAVATAGGGLAYAAQAEALGTETRPASQFTLEALGDAVVQVATAVADDVSTAVDAAVDGAELTAEVFLQDVAQLIGVTAAWWQTLPWRSKEKLAADLLKAGGSSAAAIALVLGLPALAVLAVILACSGNWVSVASNDAWTRPWNEEEDEPSPSS